MSGTLYILTARGCGGCAEYKSRIENRLMAELKRQQDQLRNDNKLSFAIERLEVDNMRTGVSPSQKASLPKAIGDHKGWWPAFYWVPVGTENEPERAKVMWGDWNPRTGNFILNQYEVTSMSLEKILEWLRRNGVISATAREPRVMYRGSGYANNYRF